MNWPESLVLHFFSILAVTWTEAKDALQAAALVVAGAGGAWVAFRKAIGPVERELIRPSPQRMDFDSTNPPEPDPLWSKFDGVYAAVTDLSKVVGGRFDVLDRRLIEHDSRFNIADFERGKQARQLMRALEGLEKLKGYVVKLEQNYQRERRDDGREGR